MHFIFDAFGTLFRTRSDLLVHGQEVHEKTARVMETYRRRILELTWVTGFSGVFIPFDELSRSAASHAMAVHGIQDDEIRKSLEGIYENPVPFTDAEPAIMQLYAAGKKLYILSNGTWDMLENALLKCKWDAYFSGFFSVEAVNSYKPDPKVYQSALASFGIPKEDVLFVSSNDWDVFGATRAGLKSAWLNRSHTHTYAYPGKQPLDVFEDLSKLPARY